MYKADIKVTLKKSVFDPQGATVMNSLKTLGFETVTGVRIGKAIELQLNAKNIDDAKAKVETMCDQLLANPVVETYSYKVEESN